MLRPRPWASRVDLPRTIRRGDFQLSRGEAVVLGDGGNRVLVAHQRLVDHRMGDRRAQVALIVAQDSRACSSSLAVVSLSR